MKIVISTVGKETICKTYDNSTAIIDTSEFHKEFKEIHEYLRVGSEDATSIRLDLNALIYL